MKLMRLKHLWTLLDSLYEGIIIVDAGNRVSYWNKSASRITGFSASEAMGRVCCDELLNHLDFMGHDFANCPLRQTLADGQPREAQLFLLHKDGHRLNVNARTHPLNAEDGSILGAVEILLDRTRRGDILKDLEARRGESYTDLITGAGNRSFAELTLSSRIEAVSALSFGVLLIHLNNFQSLLETYGQNVADQALKAAAQTLAGALRQNDVLTRWGGEDFLIIAPNIDAASCAKIAGRLSRLLNKSSVVAGKRLIPLKTAVSGTLATPGDQADDLLARCRQQL